MTGQLVLLMALVAIAAGSNDVTRCYDCFTSTASSACHEHPENEPNGKAVCPRGTKRCVTERHETSDGSMISLRRRCATQLESRFSYNRCDEQKDGTAICLSFCKDPICNKGSGKLFKHFRVWNHDSPDYADYMFDPDQAVLDPAYGGEARYSKHIQDDLLRFGGNSAASLAVSVTMLLTSVVMRLMAV